MRLERMSEVIHSVGSDPNAQNVENLVKRVKKINRRIDKCQLDMVNIIGTQRVSMHSSEMYLNFLMAMRTIINRYVSVGMQAHALAELVANGTVMTPINNDEENSNVNQTDDDDLEDLLSKHLDDLEINHDDINPVVMPLSPAAKELKELDVSEGSKTVSETK